MAGLLRRKIFAARPFVKHNTKHESLADVHKDIASQDKKLPENMFLKYLGQTVTVITASGGPSGIGFTGVLLSADRQCVRLLIEPGPVPACPLFFNRTANLFPRPVICSLGSLAVIRTEKIVAFIHNAV